MNDTVYSTELPRGTRRQGKVRDVYDLGDRLLIVACDRISAFDVVLPSAIPEKGRLLTRLSEFWFRLFEHMTPHHLLEVVGARPPVGFEPYAEQLRDRAMLCVKCEVVPIECVVRGYLSGSAWRDYRNDGAVCGISLPPGLQQCEQLPQPIFTPATKETTGHDLNISFERACDLVGGDVMRHLRDKSIEYYLAGAEYARQRGVIIADTKFEWGRCKDRWLLVDEVLTPDSSRFWPAEDYAAGRDQESFDKQFVRNYLQQRVDRGQWAKNPPGPTLPPEVISQTTAKYVEAFERLTGCRYERDVARPPELQ